MPGREAYLGENQAWEKGRLGEEYAWKSISVRELRLEESDACKSPMPLREACLREKRVRGGDTPGREARY
jgi:hypothetical protein